MKGRNSSLQVRFSRFWTLLITGERYIQAFTDNRSSGFKFCIIKVQIILEPSNHGVPFSSFPITKKNMLQEWMQIKTYFVLKISYNVSQIIEQMKPLAQFIYK